MAQKEGGRMRGKWPTQKEVARVNFRVTPKTLLGGQFGSAFALSFWCLAVMNENWWTLMGLNWGPNGMALKKVRRYVLR